ncbi:MAG: hypothetical protein GX061_03265 [Eubacteriaceae bacterium]|nr:hypothetical protein [Eubacteriaceae bacterium]
MKRKISLLILLVFAILLCSCKGAETPAERELWAALEGTYTSEQGRFAAFETRGEELLFSCGVLGTGGGRGYGKLIDFNKKTDEYILTVKWPEVTKQEDNIYGPMDELVMVISLITDSEKERIILTYPGEEAEEYFKGEANY